MALLILVGFPASCAYLTSTAGSLLIADAVTAGGAREIYFAAPERAAISAAKASSAVLAWAFFWISAISRSADEPLESSAALRALDRPILDGGDVGGARTQTRLQVIDLLTKLGRVLQRLGQGGVVLQLLGALFAGLDDLQQVFQVLLGVVGGLVRFGGDLVEAGDRILGREPAGLERVDGSLGSLGR